MPQSYQEHNGDNSTHTFTIAFGSGTKKYLKREHIKLYYGRDRVAGTQNHTLALGTDYVYISEFVIKLIGSAVINTGVTVGDPYPLPTGRTLTIERDTPQDSLLVPWADGSNLTKEALETSNLQVLFGQQEEGDTGILSAAKADAAETRSLTAAANVATLTNSQVDKDGSVAMQGNLQLGTNRITGVGDPTGAQDAVTKAFLERTGSVSSGMIANDSIVDADINSSAAISQSKIATGTLPSGIKVNSDNIVNGSIVAEDIQAGALDGRYYTETELLTNGVLDARYYTESEADARFYNLASSEEIQSGETWTAADDKVATTAAIDNRIVDLVDEVGGFVPLVSEANFPAANPDVNNGAGTIVSVGVLSTSYTPSSGTVTIPDGTLTNISGSNVTITDCGTTVLAAGFGVLVETTTTLHTYKFHRLTPKATENTTVAANAPNISTVAGISSDVTTVAGISANVTTCANDSTAINNITTNLSAVQNAATNATNAASSATAAATSETNANTHKNDAQTAKTAAESSQTAAAASQTAAASSASAAATSATNAAASASAANADQLTTLGHKNATAGIFTQSESGIYNLTDSVSSHTDWGNITDTGNAHFANESDHTKLTMTKGTATYNYGTIT